MKLRSHGKILHAPLVCACVSLWIFLSLPLSLALAFHLESHLPSSSLSLSSSSSLVILLRSRIIRSRAATDGALALCRLFFAPEPLRLRPATCWLLLSLLAHSLALLTFSTSQQGIRSRRCVCV